MKKTIFRAVKDSSNPYVMINKIPLNDANLSWQAKGILSYILSLPDDWKIYESELTKHTSDGIKCTRSAIKELIKRGYIERKRLKDAKGRFEGFEYCVYEQSIMPKTENGEAENGKGHTTNNNLTNNNSTKYNNDNGAISSESCTVSFINQDVVKAINTYMDDLYKQKTGRKHQRIKAEQYRSVYDKMASFADEWNVEYDQWLDMMEQFLNSNIDSDWNINHFATDGIMTNRFYERCY